MRDDLHIKECACCGKLITVLYPTRWAYKKPKGNNWIYYCTWKCLRKAETDRPVPVPVMSPEEERKDEEQMKNKRITLEQKKQVVELALKGEDPKPLLKQFGQKNPSAAWDYIRKRLEVIDPEQYAKICEIEAAKKPAAKPKTEKQKPAEEKKPAEDKKHLDKYMEQFTQDETTKAKSHILKMILASGDANLIKTLTEALLNLASIERNGK